MSLVVGENLKAMVDEGLCSDPDAFDHSGVSISLSPEVAYMRVPKAATVEYGRPIPSQWVEQIELVDGLKLNPGDTVLGCSNELFRIPRSLFGMVQTKGSLARLFVSVHCADPQIDPGFKGKVTLELRNDSKFAVNIPVGAKIAQMYLFRTSTANVRPYNGRYQSALGPTPYKPR